MSFLCGRRDGCEPCHEIADTSTRQDICTAVGETLKHFTTLGLVTIEEIKEVLYRYTPREISVDDDVSSVAVAAILDYESQLEQLDY